MKKIQNDKSGIMVANKLGNRGVKVREFAIVFPFALPRLGRTKDKNNTIFTDFNLAFSKYGDKSVCTCTSDIVASTF